MSQQDLTKAQVDFNRDALLRLLAEDAREVMGYRRQQATYDSGLYRYYGEGKPPKNGQYEPCVETGGTRAVINDYDWGVTFHWHWKPDTAEMDPQAVGIVGHPDYEKMYAILNLWFGDVPVDNAKAIRWLETRMGEVEQKYRDEPMYRPKPPKKAREGKSKLAARDE